MTWVDEDTQQWHRKTFYGVTISEQDWDARDIESGLMENQQFEAQYFVPDSGSTATPPNISQSLPYWVQYVGTNEVVTLYTYDPASRSFTAQANTNGRAVIGYTNGAFGVQFAADDFPVMATSGPASLPYRSGAIYRNANTYRQSALLIAGGIFTGVSLEIAAAGFLLRQPAGVHGFAQRGVRPRLYGGRSGECGWRSGHIWNPGRRRVGGGVRSQPSDGNAISGDGMK